jgi:hypothetical protein
MGIRPAGGWPREYLNEIEQRLCVVGHANYRQLRTTHINTRFTRLHLFGNVHMEQFIFVSTPVRLER